MSASVSIAKANYMGDPGLFDFFKGVVKTGLGVASVIPGIGGAAAAARSMLFPGDARVNIPGASTLPSLPKGLQIPQSPTAMPGSRRPTMSTMPVPTRGRGAGPCPSGFQVGPIRVDPQAFWPGGDPLFSLQGKSPMAQDQFGVTTAMLAGKATGFPGYHWNKSSYFLMSGEYVPAGTRAVRNRRRNPCNPRAVSRALGRVKAAKRFAKSISHVSIRKRSAH